MEITELLKEAESGDRRAQDRLYQSVYDELYRLAAGHRYRWNGNDTLNTTALVHETYLKLVQLKHPEWHDRRHFFAVASRAMRHVLVDRARRTLAAKRGSGKPLPDVDVAALADDSLSGEVALEMLALDQALDWLEAARPRQVKVVECRFFAGLNIEETSEALDVSAKTVQRDWEMAKIWLQQKLERAPGS